MQPYQEIKKLLTRSEQKQMLSLIYMLIVGMLLETMSLGLVMSSIVLMTQQNLTHNHPVFEAWLKHFNLASQTKLIAIGIFTLVIVYFVKTAFVILVNWKKNKFIFGVQESLSRRLLKGYIEQSWAFHLQKNSAQLIHNIVYEVSDFTLVVLQSSIILITEGLIFLGISCALLIVEPLGTVIVLGFISVVVSVFYLFVRHRIVMWGKLRQQYSERKLLYLQQSLGGVKDAKVLGRESNFINLFSKQNIANFKISQKLAILMESPRLILELLVVLGLACMVIPMLARGKSIWMLISTIGFFTAAAFRLMPAVNRMFGAVQGLRAGYASIFRLNSEIDLIATHSVPQKHDNKNIIFNSEIRLDHVVYKYKNASHDALNDISLTISRGDSIGFIGRSGAGKSTLVDSILGLLTPQSGTIYVDKVNIQDQLRGWQDQIGYVSQAIFLTDDTLKRNVAFGLPDEEIDDVAVEKAIKIAHLDEYISGLPDGINTVVGERGIRLSGGQRQRIGIARALYHDPQVLILDEATSSLDSTIESEVMQDINELKGIKTLIIVAHRMTTVKNCNYVYRLDQGKIIDSGSFVDVISREHVQLKQKDDKIVY